MKNAKFPSKILLFGEYTVLTGSAALAVPFYNYYGHWTAGNTQYRELMLKFGKFIHQIPDNEITSSFNFERFTHDLNKGVVLSIDVPIGYGLGSSGVVTAAIYDEYFEQKPDQREKIIFQLARCEDFFHAHSSGLDPAVSYFKKNILIENKNKFEFIDNQEILSDSNIYIIDSGISRNTKDYVAIYKSKLENKSFIEKFVTPCSKYNDEIIQAFLNGEKIKIKHLFMKISELQLEYLPEMILPEIRTLWQKSKEMGICHFKLCGAGGGGFYMIYSDHDITHNNLFVGKKLISVGKGN